MTASQVVDRDTLITFVEEAARVYSEALSEGYSTLTGLRNAFREEGGDWKSGSIYLWVVSGGGVTLFHATEPFREGRPTDMTRTDVNGVMFAQELIGGARREGRRFLEYYYDDPTIVGDEDTGSPKFGYAVSFEVPNSQQKAVIGSGIYIRTTGAGWLTRFGREVAEQVLDGISDRIRGHRDVEARTLLAHVEDGFTNRGFAAQLVYDPSPGTRRGPSLSLRQESGGMSSGGVDALFAAYPLHGGGGYGPGRWTAEAGWGLPAFGEGFTGSPHVRYGLSGMARDYGVGWRLASESRAARRLSLDILATRREIGREWSRYLGGVLGNVGVPAEGGAGADHGGRLDLRVAW